MTEDEKKVEEEENGMEDSVAEKKKENPQEEIPGDGIAYLRAASRFVNERLEGTLGANVLVHPRYRRKLGREFEWFVESLRYGTIAINAWTGVGYLTAAAPWGGFPGATLVDVDVRVSLVAFSVFIGSQQCRFDGLNHYVDRDSLVCLDRVQGCHVDIHAQASFPDWPDNSSSFGFGGENST